MLEKPDLQDAKIVDCLRDAYGLDIAEIAFLPLGADRNTAVYRAGAGAGVPYFVKLRREDFDEPAVMIPRLLHDQGIQQVIAPLLTRSRRLWADLDDFKVTVSPFVEGYGGFEVDLLDHHWVEFGRALKRIHTAALPPAVMRRIPRETYSARWREIVREFQARVESAAFDEPVAAKLAALLKSKRAVISHLVERAGCLAAALRPRPLPFILCHSDIHAGNILIDTDDRLYIVDWDTLTLAPKERDLMFVGGGLGSGGRTPQEEESLFYRGYGPTEVDPVVLAYYRYERIVQDIAAYCEQLLLTDAGGDDRENGLRQLASQFLPNDVIDMAYRSEKNLPQELRSKTPADPAQG
ncbi:MAG: aminoglycoside phosphotransferase family protein [Anaerolineae bacterium]|nr:aminoglycoside phosphotransferase family protein [Anaerolineae bacterium]